MPCNYSGGCGTGLASHQPLHQCLFRHNASGFQPLYTRALYPRKCFAEGITGILLIDVDSNEVRRYGAESFSCIHLEEMPRSTAGPTLRHHPYIRAVYDSGIQAPIFISELPHVAFNTLLLSYDVTVCILPPDACLKHLCNCLLRFFRNTRLLITRNCAVRVYSAARRRASIRAVDGKGGHGEEGMKKEGNRNE